MEHMKDQKALARNKVYCTMSILWVLLLLITFVVNPIAAFASEVDDTKEDKTLTFYKGVATSNVNVRKGPGTNSDKLIVGESPVQLKRGDEVIIIGEAAAKDGKIWYQMKIEINGTTYEGYSTSSYINKTDKKITPTPTISPTPSPSPSPTVTPIPPTTMDQESDVSNPNGKDSEGSSFLTWLIIGIVLAVVAAVAFVLLKLVRAGKVGAQSSVSRKVDELKNIKLDQKNQRQDQASGRKKPVIRRLPDEPLDQANSRRDLYLNVDERMADIFDGASPYDEAKDDLIQKNASREAEEKQIMRLEVDRLREHDIVRHKYFGEGEVYDNSDVKLLEVRFGNDVRFLNKESLISKRLLEFVDDEQQIAMRRKNSIGRRSVAVPKKVQNRKKEE